MRRTIGIIVSVVMVGIGALLLVGYVRGAEERAVAGEELVGVYVVDNPIAQGAAIDDVIDSVRLEQVPVKVRAEGGVSSIEDLAGMVAAVNLVPGEQLVSSRFVDPADASPYTPVDLPPDLLEVTLSLSPERALGGQLVPGDVVAFIASFNPFDVAAVEPGTEELLDLGDGSGIYVGNTGDEESSGLKTPNSTHLILHGLLVTNVQVEQLPQPAGEGEGPALAPTGNLLVTLAATAPDIEKIVFTAEHGFVWIAGEGTDASVAGTTIQTRGTIYR